MAALRGFAGAALMAALAFGGVARAAVPRVGVPQVGAGHAHAVTAPYDTNADAHAQVTAGFAQAKTQHKTLLLDFGGNWCPDCRILAGLLEAPQVAPWIAQHFVVVKVDIGRFEKNMDIAQAHGVKITGAPAVLAFAPDGKLLNGDDVIALDAALQASDQAAVDKLASWVQ